MEEPRGVQPPQRARPKDVSTEQRGRAMEQRGVPRARGLWLTSQGAGGCLLYGRVELWFSSAYCRAYSVQLYIVECAVCWLVAVTVAVCVCESCGIYSYMLV